MKDMSSSRIFRRASFGGSESWIDRKDETNGTASDPDDTREPSDSLQSDHNNKRRVRFNNQVRTCPASDDETSTPSIAPLKSEIVLNGKMKKRYFIISHITIKLHFRESTFKRCFVGH